MADLPGSWPVAFGMRVLSLRRLHRLSQQELALRMGFESNVSVSRLERGVLKAVPLASLEILVAMAEAAGLTAEWVLTGSAISRTISQSDMLSAIQSLVQTRQVLASPPAQPGPEVLPPSPAVPADRGFAVSDVVGPGYKTIGPEDLSADWPARFVPVIGSLAAGETAERTGAGPPGWASEYVAYAGAPAGAFGLRIAGDSMEPEYHDGDLVIVDPARPAESGICAVLIEQVGRRMARLKRLRARRRGLVLESLNPAYAPITIARADLVGAYEIVDHLPLVARRRASKGD